MFSSAGADVVIENGASLVVQKNTATSHYGGGAYLQDEGSTFTATGDSTRATVESNTAGQSGGGMFSFSGADVMVESGATLVVQKNTAVFEGAGIALAFRGASLSVVGRDTRLHVLDNIMTSGDVGKNTTASRSKGIAPSAFCCTGLLFGPPSLNSAANLAAGCRRRSPS